jgi:hypothetical protein|tara:strand:- start:114 stop:287 length:174 start_codon:yes stop_codon:yes gene_type:complete
LEYEYEPDLTDEEWKEHPTLKKQISNKGRIISQHSEKHLVVLIKKDIIYLVISQYIG